MNGQYQGCQPGGRIRACGPFSPSVAMILPGGRETNPTFLVTTPILSSLTKRNEASTKDTINTNTAPTSTGKRSSTWSSLIAAATKSAASTSPVSRMMADIEFLSGWKDGMVTCRAITDGGPHGPDAQTKPAASLLQHTLYLTAAAIMPQNSEKSHLSGLFAAQQQILPGAPSRTAVAACGLHGS